MARPQPPGSMFEPSCSQGSQKTSPPELLQFLPDLTPSQLSFVLRGMDADLTHPWGPGPSIGLLHPRVLHATWSLLSSGTRTRCCCFAPVLSCGTCTGKSRHHPGNVKLPLRPRKEFPAGDWWTGSAVFGSRSS